MRPQLFILLGMFLLCLTSCGVQYRSTTFDAPSTSISYSDKANWAVFAGKAIDGKVIGASSESLQADVFFVYPTLLTDKKDTRWNAPIKDSVINSDVLKWVVPYQASAWATAARLYVPYYRQNHYRAFFEPYVKQGGKEAQELAYSDVKTAFEYYLTHENNGRPIILAGHSQGAIHLKRLLQEAFDGTELQQQLVAAYLIGARVMEDEFNVLKPLRSPESVGGYVSWNSYKKGKLPKYANWYTSAVTTNPVTWNNSTKSEFSQHKGLIYYNQEIIPSCLTVEVTDGLLWVSLPKVPKRFWVSFIKNYHRFDIPFFWQDIKENASLRVSEFLNQN
ncbi:MAG: DUF3089 domain-containing protein [Flavobacteriaceae bacterium]